MSRDTAYMGGIHKAMMTISTMPTQWYVLIRLPRSMRNAIQTHSNMKLTYCQKSEVKEATGRKKADKEKKTLILIPKLTTVGANTTRSCRK